MYIHDKHVVYAKKALCLHTGGFHFRLIQELAPKDASAFDVRFMEVSTLDRFKSSLIARYPLYIRVVRFIGVLDLERRSFRVIHLDKYTSISTVNLLFSPPC